MNTPRRLQDCYFFYYSTCKKGKTCQFRHEVAALGHERVCARFLKGECLVEHCPDRHMVIEKLRQNIPCYWESTTGCTKPHCVFKHNSQPINMVGGPAAAVSTVGIMDRQ